MMELQVYFVLLNGPNEMFSSTVCHSIKLAASGLTFIIGIITVLHSEARCLICM